MASRLTADCARELLRDVTHILFDIDGVLWAGDKIFPRAQETIQFLKRRGKEVRFVSNNAEQSRQNVLEKFKRKGFADVELSEIYNSGFAAALYLQGIAEKEGKAKFDHNVFVVGGRGLREELSAVVAEGCLLYGPELNASREGVPSNLLNPAIYDVGIVSQCVTRALLPAPFAPTNSGEPQCCSLNDLNFGAVVAGLDNDATFTKLAVASLCLQQRRAGKQIHFVATNCDPQYPVGESLMPGAGTMGGFVSTASGFQPDVVCGKPGTMLYDIMERHEHLPQRSSVLMVGDRLTTDIAFGVACGLQTLLVLTGCETVDDIAKTGITPTYVADGVWDMLWPE